MLNKIWFWLLFIGIGYGFCKSAYREWFAPEPPAAAVAAEPATDEQATDEQAEDEQADPVRPFRDAGKNITEAAINAAEAAVALCLGLIGVMALWMGMLNIAQDSGMVDALASLLRPVMRWLFPDVPDGHPAQGAMLMNISANMLGLDNAATPFGLKAMQELQTLNPSEDTATNAMATFLAINTSSVTIIPIAIIALRSASGSTNPAEPVFGMILATAITTVVAIVAVKSLAKLPGYASTNPLKDGAAPPTQDSEEGGDA
ncbi:MAG: nucleoside recognition domain-containing protein [Planctomycetota bacterium]